MPSPPGLLVQCIPEASAVGASFGHCPPWAAVPLIKGLATSARQGRELQAFCSQPTPTLCLISAPGQCLCWKSQSRAWAEITDHWCHELIEDSGVKSKGEDTDFPTQDLSGHAWLQAEKAVATNSPRERDKWGLGGTCFTKRGRTGPPCHRV